MDAVGIGSIANLQANSNIDVEMFMMQVSAERANNLEGQMKDQINEVKERQAAISKMTQLLNSLSSAIKGLGEGAYKTMLGIKLPDGSEIKTSKQLVEVLKEYGCYAQNNNQNDERGGWVNPNTDGGGNERPEATKETIEGWIEQLKGRVDGLNSQGQLDMIRLQSIMNKRNESFEQMTNMMQKFNKARESIVGNMR